MTVETNINKDEGEVILQYKVRYLPVSKIKEIYGISRSYLYQLHYERKLAHYVLGQKLFIDVDELETLIQKGEKQQCRLE